MTTPKLNRKDSVQIQEPDKFIVSSVSNGNKIVLEAWYKGESRLTKYQMDKERQRIELMESCELQHADINTDLVNLQSQYLLHDYPGVFSRIRTRR